MGDQWNADRFLSALTEAEQQAHARLETVRSAAECQAIRTDFFGKQGQLTGLLRHMGALTPAERPTIGSRANDIKVALENKLQELEIRLQSQERAAELKGVSVDVSLPGRMDRAPSLHPVTLVMREVVRIFSRLGFTIAVGPEVEEDFYNFEALNIPASHPSRDAHDTFFIDDTVVLRTHTSSVQVRTMLAQAPPLRILAPGRVYRSDYDVSHTPMFHQVEGLLIEESVSFADLKGALQHFAHTFFGKKAQLRFRPSFFPFTEPSAEVDVRCVLCDGVGCRACKQSGWLEILGCGMVDPEVFKAVDYDPLKWSGFAFGMGVERMAMLKYGVGDLRLFFEGDMRFLNQFRSLRWKSWTESLTALSETAPPEKKPSEKKQ